MTDPTFRALIYIRFQINPPLCKNLQSGGYFSAIFKETPMMKDFRLMRHFGKNSHFSHLFSLVLHAKKIFLHF